MIRVYCVGIYFRKEIKFESDAKIGGVEFMYGSSILGKCADKELRYQVNEAGHLEYVSYSPKVGDTFAHFPDINGTTPQPPIVKPLLVPPGKSSDKPKAPRAFPFYGQPLSLFENPQPIGQMSQILQYTVTPGPIDFNGKKTTTADPANPEFYFTGFPDDCEIRIRLVSIYVSQAPTY